MEIIQIKEGKHLNGDAIIMENKYLRIKLFPKIEFKMASFKNYKDNRSYKYYFLNSIYKGKVGLHYINDNIILIRSPIKEYG